MVVNTLGIVLLAVGAVFVALAYPLRTGRVKMNHLYGMRFPQSYYSEKSWYKINAYGGGLLMIWAVLVMVAGVVLTVVPVNVSRETVLIALVVTFFVPVIITYAYASNFTP